MSEPLDLEAIQQTLRDVRRHRTMWTPWELSLASDLEAAVAEIERLRALPASPRPEKALTYRPADWLESEIELTAFVLANPDCDVRAVLRGFAELVHMAAAPQKDQP